MKNKNRTSICIFFYFLLFITIHFWISSCQPILQKEHSQISKGRILYNKYCIECHGTDGLGAGFYKKYYKIDLSRIMIRRNADEFPINEIARYIDGREYCKKFGPREMPMWGVEMNKLEGQFNPDTSRSNLGAIVSYLISLQKIE